MDSPWLSIVTVVKDDAAGFAATVESVRRQEVSDIEFIVVDSSSDHDEIPALLDGSPHRYAWVAPAGIYPAMNDGLSLATGEYVYFLNAGDTLIAADALTAVRALIAAESPEWLFADVEMVDDRGNPLVTPPWDYTAEERACFARGHFPCHQGTFVRRTTLAELGGFDPSYRITADYAMFLKLSRRARPGRVDGAVAAFQPGGVSSQRWREAIDEFHRARREILRPTGWAAVREQADTWKLLAATVAYRGLWAPGKLLHGVVTRLRAH